MIGIIDYNAGNLKSVESALRFIDTEFIISKKPKDLEKCDKIIFPGVGDAKFAMEQLNKTGFDLFLKNFVAQNKPLLGICLGSQIIFEHSEEGDVKCLGLIKGNIRHIKNVLPKNHEVKIPHMGWNNIYFTKITSNIFKDIRESSDFYFVHSYLIVPQDMNVVCTYTKYGGINIPAGIKSGNINALQFHPEKSGDLGLKVLQNFCKNYL